MEKERDNDAIIKTTINHITRKRETKSEPWTEKGRERERERERETKRNSKIALTQQLYLIERKREKRER